MSNWSVRIAALVLLVSTVGLVLETKRMAARVGEAERLIVVSEARASAAERRLSESLSPPAAVAPQSKDAGNVDSQQVGQQSMQEPAGLPQAAQGAGSNAIDLNEFTRLQVDLHSARQQLAAVTDLLEQKNAEIRRKAEAEAEAARNSLKPMPAGVRLCLDSLHQCLRGEGYTNQRFLRASSIDDAGMHGVEMLDASPDGLAVAFVNAELMTAKIDRGTGRLELRFFDGYRAVDGERLVLPEDGFAVTFEEVDGRLFERRLPFLLHGEGFYQVVESGNQKPSTDLDPGTRRQWLTRLDLLISSARTALNWRVTRMRGMSDGYFLTVELVGTSDNHLVKGSVHCDRMAVEIDEVGGVVSLLLQDGVLRRDGLESTITNQGYRMLLPGLTPKETIDAMLGMVVKK